VTWRHAAILCLVLVVFASRLCHLDVIWIEEAYGLAAAREMLAGKALYRDIWFDKPPLYALVYIFWLAQDGWPLRVGGSLFVLLGCALAYRFARDKWGPDEGVAAAGLLGFYLTFGIPSAVIALAPDLLMVVPHIAAVCFAWREKPLIAGMLAGVALLCNPKGVFVLAACFMCAPRSFIRLSVGFVLPNALALALLDARSYWEQVWSWGFRYSADTFIGNPLTEAAVRTMNWAGFHAVLVVTGAAVYLWRERNWRFLLWMGVSMAAVVTGWRFFPRYYFALLPVFVLTGARGLCLLTPRWRAAVLALMLIPAIRFGPRYVQLARDGGERWSDLALMHDSRRAAKLLDSTNESTLLVWGYRPDVFIFSGLSAGTRFLDSQPLTGVLADRHLRESRPTLPDIAARNRQELMRSYPSFIVDGLGPLNPELAITQFQDLQPWLARYEVIGRTELSVVYRLLAPPNGSALP
jgi:hypothetical protein